VGVIVRTARARVISGPAFEREMARTLRMKRYEGLRRNGRGIASNWLLKYTTNHSRYSWSSGPDSNAKVKLTHMLDTFHGLSFG
jgi:hypothetical protein